MANNIKQVHLMVYYSAFSRWLSVCEWYSDERIDESFYVNRTIATTQSKDLAEVPIYNY